MYTALIILQYDTLSGYEHTADTLMVLGLGFLEMCDQARNSKYTQDILLIIVLTLLTLGLNWTLCPRAFAALVNTGVQSAAAGGVPATCG